MKNKIVLFIMFLFCLLDLNSVEEKAKSLSRIAITSFTGLKNQDRQAGLILAKLFSDYFATKEDYFILPRDFESIGAVMAEKKYQQDTAPGSDDITLWIGEFLKADLILNGVFDEFAGCKYFFLSLYNIESKEIIAGTWVQYYLINEIKEQIPKLSEILLAQSRRKQMGQKIGLSNVSYAIDGGGAEYEVVLTRIMIAELVKTGQYRVLIRSGQVIEEINNIHLKDKALPPFDVPGETGGKATLSDLAAKASIEKLGMEWIIRIQLIDKNGVLKKGCDVGFDEKSGIPSAIGQLSRKISGIPEAAEARKSLALNFGFAGINGDIYSLGLGLRLPVVSCVYIDLGIGGEFSSGAPSALAEAGLSFGPPRPIGIRDFAIDPFLTVDSGFKYDGFTWEFYPVLKAGLSFHIKAAVLIGGAVIFHGPGWNSDLIDPDAWGKPKFTLMVGFLPGKK